MQETDREKFNLSVRSVMAATRLRTKRDEEAELLRLYFEALKAYSMEEIVASVRKLLTTCDRFPTLQQWLAALDPLAKQVAATDIPMADTLEAVEYDNAERDVWERDPCACATCRETGADHLPMRFVPYEHPSGHKDAGHAVKKIHPRKGTVIFPGHWIHGAELKRWYKAKGDFYENLNNLPRAKGHKFQSLAVRPTEA